MKVYQEIQSNEGKPTATYHVTTTKELDVDNSRFIYIFSNKSHHGLYLLTSRR